MEVPSAFSLYQNYPNPFNPETTISYGIAKTGTVRLSIYALTGQAIRTLVDGTRIPGTYSVLWDGKDSTGRDVASGVYLYRLDVQGQRVDAKRMVLIR